ncbi:MAG: site-specific DNA-methyltransferase [Verrucomicrobia bacterium]|nr:site-specific DNA-methyltransferase [Verrucomicrobiota bacterium]
MPELKWIGKEAVVRHHAEVPFRLLEEVPELSCRPSEGDTENLIVQGDNLEALKALLPRYAGQVKCIYIDPPYNTGNEGWVYNDAGNSPEIRQWLGKVVGKEAEDLSRHDKWLCMMYPRLVLLRQFLRDDGAIFVSLDDNEVASLRLVMDEIFGKNNFCAQVTVQCNPKGRVLAQEFAKTHEYVLVYSRVAGGAVFEVPKTLDDILFEYTEVDSSGRRYRPMELRNTHRQFNKETRPNLHFPLYVNHKTGEVSVENRPACIEVLPNWPDGMQGCWTWDRAKCREDREDLFAKNVRGGWKVFRKAYATDEAGEVVTKKPKSIWLDPDIHTEKGQKQIDEILGGRIFYAPKALALVRYCIELTSKAGDLILDSFAGSGTTGHAVLALNKQDGGNRRFVLVELDEKIAREITRERVSRVATSYKNAKGEAVAGLGGGFQFARLGKPLFAETGAIRSDVKFGELAEFVFFKETGRPLPAVGRNQKRLTPLLGVHEGRAVYLLFNGILGDKTTNGGNVLTGPVLAKLPPHDGPKVIYAAACRLGRARQDAEQIKFKQTPYDLHVS